MNTIPRVTEVVKTVYGDFDEQSFKNWCIDNGEDYEYIMKFSSEFGTKMHAWILEQKRPDEITDIMIECYRQWRLAQDKYSIEIVESETPLKLIRDNMLLCTGTRDSVCLLNGVETQVDLKFYSCWRGLNYKYKEPSEDKLKKANLQTYIYNNADGRESMPRAVLHIMPSGYGMYPFQRRPLKQYEQALQFCKSWHKHNTF